MTGAGMVKDIDFAVTIFYERIELTNKDIQKLFSHNNF